MGASSFMINGKPLSTDEGPGYYMVIGFDDSSGTPKYLTGVYWGETKSSVAGQLRSAYAGAIFKAIFAFKSTN